MTSKNNPKKYGFSSLSIYRVANEELGKLKNNKIYYSYQNAPNNINNSNMSIDTKIKNKDLAQSHQINQKNTITNEKKPKEVKDSKNSINRNNSAVKVQHYSSIGSGGEIEPKNHNKKNVLKVSHESKERDKNSSINKKSVNTHKSKVIKKRNVDHIDRIIIDLVNDDCENDTIKTESNYYKKEKLYKKYINDENEENYGGKNLLNKDNNITGKDGLEYAMNMIENRWKDKCVESKEINLPVLSNEIFRKKKKIENLMKNRKNIVKEIDFSIIKQNNIRKKEDSNNSINKWNDSIRKENNKYFTITKSVNKDNFLYSEMNYIKDLTKNINLQPNNFNTFYLLNNDNYINDDKLDYKLVKPKNKNQLESDLYKFYQEKKSNYLKNKDNNEELKINPIYVLNDKQIQQLRGEITNDDKSRNNNKNEFLINQLSVEKMPNVDYEIIEVFTPKNKNLDNNTNDQISKRSSNLTKDLKNEKVSEVNYKSEKKSSGEFGQYTPISMLSDKFGIYAVSRNVKYSVPQRQGFISILNHNKGSYNYDKLKRNNFSLKIEWYEQGKDSLKNSKDTTKRNNERIDKKNDGSIIDYSKISSHKSSHKNTKINK